MSCTTDHTPTLSRREAALALLVAVAVASIVLWRVVFLGQIPVPADALAGVEPWQSEAGGAIVRGTSWNPLMTDALWQVVPDGIAAHRLWSDGLPLWEPNVACGVPGLAQGKMFSNPGFNLIARVAGPVRAIGWTALLQLAMALWGAYLLLRQLGAIPVAAALGAAAFGLNLYLLVWLPHTPFFGAMVWLPMVFFTFERSLATGRASWAALGAVVFAIQILEGHIATPFFGAITLGLWSLVRGVARVRASGRLQALAGPIAAAACILVGGALLVAPQLFMTVELYFETPRSQAIGANSTVPLEQGLRVVAPWLWGHRFHGGTYVGPFNVAELGLYFGVLPLALIPLAPLGRRRLEGWFFAVTAVVCGMVVFDLPPLRAVLGWIYPIVYQSFPGRIFAMSAFTGAIAAGLGAHWLLSQAQIRHRRRWVAAMVVLAVAAWSAAVWVDQVHRSRSVERFGASPGLDWLVDLRVESLFWAGSWAIAAAALVLWCRRDERPRPRLLWAVALIAAADLLHASAGMTPFFEAEQVLPSTPTIERLADLVDGSEHSARILPVPSQFVIPGQVPTKFELPSISSYSSWGLTRYSRYTRLSGARYLEVPFLYFDDCCGSLLNDLACRYVVTPGDGVLRSEQRGTVLRLLQDGPVRIWENRRAVPRARLVDGVQTAHPGDLGAVARLLSSPGFRSRHQVVLETDGLEVEFEAAGGRMRPARVVDDRPTRVEVEIEAVKPAVLVLADTWYPGWEATVDGEKATVHPANLALRGVVVPAGASSVVFEYRPRWLVPGFVVSALAALVLVVLARLSPAGQPRPSGSAGEPGR